MIKFISKLKLLSKIIEVEKKEPNDFILAGKIRNLLDHYKATGEIKDNPKGRRL